MGGRLGGLTPSEPGLHRRSGARAGTWSGPPLGLEPGFHRQAHWSASGPDQSSLLALGSPAPTAAACVGRGTMPGGQSARVPSSSMWDTKASRGRPRRTRGYLCAARGAVLARMRWYAMLHI